MLLGDVRPASCACEHVRITQRVGVAVHSMDVYRTVLRGGTNSMRMDSTAYMWWHTALHCTAGLSTTRIASAQDGGGMMVYHLYTDVVDTQHRSTVHALHHHSV